MKHMYRSMGRLAFIVICVSTIVRIGESQENSDVSKAPQGTRTANVVDAIQMTQLVVENRGDISSSGPAQFSPDGQYFVVVTKKGNIETNTNIYSLLLFPTNKAILSPNPILLASMASSSNDPGIQDVKWIDDRTLAFLGENPGELQQVYKVDRDTRHLTKLTSNSTSVLSYEGNAKDRSVLFLAHPPLKPLFDEKSGKDWVVVSNEPLWDLIAGVASTGGPRMPRAELFITKDNQESRVGTQGNLEPRAGLLLSPDARYVIVKGLVTELPEIWKDYEDRQLRNVISASSSHEAVRVIYQYEVINLQSGETKALPDAPVSDGNRSDVLWSLDSNSVIVASYLPLNVPDIAERKLRQSKKMLVEIKVPSGELVPISSRELHPIEWDPRDGKTLIARTSSASDRG